MKVKVFGLLLIAILTLVGATTTFAQGDEFGDDDGVVVDGNGYYHPRTDSPTGMRQCGMTEERMRELGYTQAIVLEAPLPVTRMQYCTSKGKAVRWTSRLSRRYGGRQIVLAPGTTIYIRPGDYNNAVAGGCLNLFEGNIPQPPRPVVTPVVPVPVPVVPTCPEGTTPIGPGLCLKEREIEKDCPECPPDIVISPHVSSMTRFVTGGWMGTAISGGASCAISGILNKRLEDCLRDGLIAVGANRATQAINPSPDGVKVVAEGQPRIFRIGHEGKISENCELKWEGKMAYVRCGELICERLVLTRNLNTTVFATNRRNGTTTPAIKSQPATSIPTRPQIPPLNTPNPTPAYPTRPRAPEVRVIE